MCVVAVLLLKQDMAKVDCTPSVLLCPSLMALSEQRFGNLTNINICFKVCISILL
jgi:hypothetical protein